MITLLGVGHVFDIKARVREEILHRGPEVVGLELDPDRLHALSNRNAPREGPILYRLMAGFQGRIAESYGGQVGDEMLAAAKAAQDVGAKVALIDIDSRDLIGRLWSAITFEERIKLFVSAISALFIRKSSVEREIQHYEADQKAYLDEFSRQFPTVKRILIDERDAHMAKALRELGKQHERVVAVVGDGHVEGLRALLADLPLDVVRLNELRKPAAMTTSEFSYSFSSRG